MLVVLSSVLFFNVKSIQNWILILFSFVFYAFNSPIILLLFIFCIGINVVTSYFVVRKNLHPKKIATLSVLINLLILIFFKYSQLVVDTFFTNGFSVRHKLSQIPLPIGISFFTFQGIGLLVDTFRNKINPAHQSLVPKSFKYAFFPQIVAKPIVQAKGLSILSLLWTLKYKAYLKTLFVYILPQYPCGNRISTDWVLLNQTSAKELSTQIVNDLKAISCS